MNPKELLTFTLSTPTAWFMELYKLHDAGFTASIAGGCLRDLDNGAPIKDVDIFVNPEPTSVLGDLLGTGLSKFYAYADALGWEQNHAASYTNIGDVEAIWTYTQGGVEYNVILLRKPLNLSQLVSRMDFGICQIAANSEGVVWCSEAYAKDRQNKTFTMMDADREDRSKARFERLQEKYPGWKLA